MHTEIDAVIGELIAAWNRHDLQRYASFWLGDADFVNVVGMHHHGRDKILAELEWLHADRFRNTEIHNLGHSVRFLSPEVAVVHMRWEMRNDPGMPGYPTKDGVRRGIFTHVAQHTREGWRFVASQNTDVVAMAAA